MSEASHLPSGTGPARPAADDIQAIAARPAELEPQHLPGSRRAVLPAPAGGGPGRGRPWRVFCLGVLLPLLVMLGANMLGLLRVELGGRPAPSAAAPAAGLTAVKAPPPLAEARLAAYAAAPAAGPAAAPAPAVPDARLSAELDDVGAELDELRLLTAVVVLEEAVQSSRPFMGELALAIKAAGDDPDLLARLDQLMPWAETGVSTRSELGLRFPAVAHQARLVAAESRGAALQSATLLMRDLALWVGLGEPPAADLQRALDRAGSAVEHGRLGEAVETLATVEDPALDVVRPWLANVGVRHAIDRTIEQVRQAALDRALNRVE